MSEPEKKRKRDGRDDGSPTAAEEGAGGVIGAARDSMIAEFRAMLERTRSQMMVETQGKVDATERRSDELAKRCKAQEERGRFLEARCDSLERSVLVLAKNSNWEYSAPDIPDSYWQERGFNDEYVETMRDFIQDMKDETLRMRSGENVNDNSVMMRSGKNVRCISLNGLNWLGQQVLLHDEALLPHWQEFTDALQLSNISDGYFCTYNIQLPSVICDMLTSALSTKKITSLEFHSNDFANPSDGTQVAITLIENNQHLEEFKWIDNPIVDMDQVNDLLKVLISHPKLTNIYLRGSIGSNDVNGYEFLCSLLASSKHFLTIDLESNNIAAKGRTNIPDFLATNPPLQHLLLNNNNLDDDDAMLIAEALKLNINLREMELGENVITHIGKDTLHKAVFDPTSMNSMADCNHTCWIRDLDFDCENEDSPKLNRAWKLYSLLSAKYHEGSIVNDLDLEFGCDAVKYVPQVLERVHLYSGCLDCAWRQAQPLSIINEILRGWKMPELFEGTNHQ